MGDEDVKIDIYYSNPLLLAKVQLKAQRLRSFKNCYNFLRTFLIF